MAKTQKKTGGSKKYLRNRRPVDSATSLYSKGKITFEQYQKRLRKGK